ncbi:hypothetical protein B0I37DRAFT_159074 [Chaetomium sp. MPI-CAGE-AT-0009]|nr:hypothetical protein B0I37DRAFT_159074 [Chaetomium sp. MPI-CAGE-AT-0009]
MASTPIRRGERFTGRRWLVSYFTRLGTLLLGLRSGFTAFRLRKKGADAIPLFHVHDDSSVTVQEIASAKQRSAVENSFRATDFQASASGGFGGVTAGASVGVSSGTGSGEGSQKTENASTLRVSYNFPRVALYLDAESLTLTDECRDMLQKAHAATGSKQDSLIERFECLFGQIFRTVVKLGGCLYSEKLSSSVAGESTEHKMESMKIAAGASLNTPYGSGSTSISHSTGSNSTTESTFANQSQSLAWQARGGDTLLCSNPKAWVPTVQNLYNCQSTHRPWKFFSIA